MNMDEIFQKSNKKMISKQGNEQIFWMIFMRCLDIFGGNIDFQNNYVAIIDPNLQNGLYIDLP